MAISPADGGLYPSRSQLALLLCAAGLLSITLLPNHAHADATAPDLEVRTDPHDPWLRYRIGGDLLGIAWHRYMLDLEVGLGRHHGPRLEAGWKHGENRGPMVGLGYEVWPLGRGVTSFFIGVGGRVNIALESPRSFDAYGELGYRHYWRGATIGASLGAVHRWAWSLQERAVAPMGRITVGWAF